MTELNKEKLLVGDPVLLLGWREGNRLHAATVPVHDQATPELREICSRAIDEINSRDERPYEQTAQLEANEQYFSIAIGDLPAPSTRRRKHSQLVVDKKLPEELDGLADALALIKAETLDQLHAGRLKQGRFTFYAIVWTQDGGRTAFVRKADPVKTIRQGAVFFRYGDQLKTVEKPDMALFATIDIVITPDRILALDQPAFQHLFSDIGLLLQDVPERVVEISDELAKAIPMTPAATAALLTRSKTRVSYASRLRQLVPRLKAGEFTPQKVREAITKHGEDPKVLLTDDDRFEFTEEQVGPFLDLLEGRWFEDDFSGERRRADRYSKRG